MNLEITNYNNSIINELTADDLFVTKTNLNESIIDDSNYVSEDSVTLTEGSVEKDEDSLDYQNEYGNIDSITNSISDEFRDLNEKCINKGVHSKNVEVDESYLKPLDLKEELKNENLIKEIVLHNIKVESDNGKITSLTSTTELKSDKMHKENDNSDDLNFYDCEDSESYENNSDKYGNFENNLNKSYDIVSKNLIDIEKIKADSLDLSSKSALKFSEICDASSDELCLDYNNHDFVSSNWLMSVNPDVNNDEFDIENVFSFKKMKLTHFKINEPLSLCFEISRKYPPLTNNDTPIDFTKIFSSSTPYSAKHKNHNKNETFSKSGTLECKFPIMETENAKPESVESTSPNLKNKTFNLEETKEIIKERKSIDTKKSTKPNSVAPCLQLTETVHDLASGKLNKLLAPKLPAIENGLVPEKPSRMTKKIGSLIAIPSKSTAQSDRPPENRSLLKLPMEPPKPPANQSAAPLKKLFTKTSSRDAAAPLQSVNGVKTRSLPPFDPNRRHTVTEEVFTSQIDHKPSSRPTSLMKPSESKPPIGNCRIAKPIRPSSVLASDKAQKSLPTAPSSQKESGIPKTVKSMKLQSGAEKKKSRNPRSSEISSRVEESSAPAAIVTPIISENPPIISPSASSISNPLNRTFDREDFQVLKSFSLLNNNDNCSSESSSSSNDATIRSSAASSSADSENNNNSNNRARSSEQLGIYQLARKEEEDLKKHVTRQTGGFRSLRLPSQIKPRLVAPAALGK